MPLSIDNVSEWLAAVRSIRGDTTDCGSLAGDNNRVTKDDMMGYDEGFDPNQPRPVCRDATDEEIRRMDAALAASRRPAHYTRVSRAPQRLSADASGWEDDGHYNSDADSDQGDVTEEETDGETDDSSEDEQDQSDFAQQLSNKARKRMRKRSGGPVVKRSKFDTLVGGGHLCMQDRLAIAAVGFKAPTLQSARRKCDRWILEGETEKLSNMFDDLVAECEPREHLRPFVMVPSLHGGFAPVGQVTQEILSLVQFADRDYLRELSCKVKGIITHIKNIE